MARPQIVEVEWLDATTKYEQMTLESARRDCRLDHRFSYGVLVEKDRERVVIAHTYDPAEEMDNKQDSGADFTTIPRGWIKRVTVLVPAATSTDEEGK